jgi:hypothetical protein
MTYDMSQDVEAVRVFNVNDFKLIYDIISAFVGA